MGTQLAQIVMQSSVAHHRSGLTMISGELSAYVGYVWNDLKYT